MSDWVPSAPCTPAACIGPADRPVSVPHAALRLAAVLTLLLAAALVLPAGRRIPPGVIRRWCRTLVRAAGVRLTLTGAAAPTGGLLLVANHVSWLDIPLLAAVRPARMLAKSDIRHWPVAGALAARGGTLFIDRDRLSTLPHTVGALAEALRRGAAVGVFPEGSTWCGRAQGPFRRAAFQAALDAHVPVQPVHLRYRHTDGPPSAAPAYIGEDSLLTSVWRVVRTRDLVAEVAVRPPIPPGTHPDRRALAHAAHPTAPAPRASHPPHRIPAPRPTRAPLLRGRTP
ncbi:lysophospholipid acyltransferase family protein [Streptomyces sp. NPDC088789]|uniref:lysophospholipid acyltransferase family protein n=1 Tax=Streptomyces sp. NPDC088789 TaxID=3365899 RepID=UPI00381D76C7